jgi:hypothetical protein
MNQLESMIRDYLAVNLDILEKGLRLVDTEYPLKNFLGASGRIDILAKDIFGNYVIVEIKRSDQAARQALHELFKYVSIIHRQLGVAQSMIRSILVSTTWHELALPFSEFLEIVPCHTEGYQISVDLDGKVKSATKFVPVSLNSPLNVSRCQNIHLYENKDERDDHIDQISGVLTGLGIVDHVLFTVDHDGSNTRVIFPHGTYVMFSSPFNTLEENEREDLKVQLRWDDELDNPDENFLVAYCHVFDGHDTMEIGTPEKLRLMEETWRIRVAVRAGRFKSNEKLLTDDDVIRLTMQTEGGSPHYLNFLSSPKFKERWTQLLDDSLTVARGNANWTNAISMIFDEIAKRDPNASVAVSIYNIANTHFSLSKMCVGDFRYFPNIEIISKENDGIRFYSSLIRWNNKKINLSPSRFFKITCIEPMYWLTAQHFGEQYEFDDLVREAAGLETPFFCFFAPVHGQPSKHELTFSDEIRYEPLSEELISGPSEFFDANKAFFRAYQALVSESASGLFETT